MVPQHTGLSATQTSNHEAESCSGNELPRLRLDTLHQTPDSNLTHSLGGNTDPGELGSQSIAQTDASPSRGDIGLPDLLEFLYTKWEKKELWEALCKLKEDRAQLLLNYLYYVLLIPKMPEPYVRRLCIVAIHLLSEESKKFPRCYDLKKPVIPENSSRKTEGKFSAILKAQCGKQHLCLKRVPQRNLETMLKLYTREAVLWDQLDHPNIAVFYGIYYLACKRDQICLVSPWMPKETLTQYLNGKSHRDVPRAPLVFNVVSGLRYLHESNVIHGDLKGSNILVNDAGQACITDFGVSFIQTDPQTNSDIMDLTEILSNVPRFDPRWAAPELLEGRSPPTKASDMWALKCVCVEIYTGRKPFHELQHKLDSLHGPKAKVDLYLEAIKSLTSKKSPRQPKISLRDQKDQAVWKAVDRCWSPTAEERPTCHEVFDEIEQAGVSQGVINEGYYDAEHKKEQFRREMDIDPEMPSDSGKIEEIIISLG